MHSDSTEVRADLKGASEGALRGMFDVLEQYADALGCISESGQMVDEGRLDAVNLELEAVAYAIRRLPAVPRRQAEVQSQTVTLATVQRFMPSNYTATQTGTVITIIGSDSAGWTLDGYVIPRLASGGIYAKEI